MHQYAAAPAPSLYRPLHNERITSPPPPPPTTSSSYSSVFSPLDVIDVPSSTSFPGHYSASSFNSRSLYNNDSNINSSPISIPTSEDESFSSAFLGKASRLVALANESSESLLKGFNWLSDRSAEEKRAVENRIRQAAADAAAASANNHSPVFSPQPQSRVVTGYDGSNNNHDGNNYGMHSSNDRNGYHHQYHQQQIPSTGYFGNDSYNQSNMSRREQQLLVQQQMQLQQEQQQQQQRNGSSPIYNDYLSTQSATVDLQKRLRGIQISSSSANNDHPRVFRATTTSSTASSSSHTPLSHASSSYSRDPSASPSIPTQSRASSGTSYVYTPLHDESSSFSPASPQNPNQNRFHANSLQSSNNNNNNRYYHLNSSMIQTSTTHTTNGNVPVFTAPPLPSSTNNGTKSTSKNMNGTSNMNSADSSRKANSSNSDYAAWDYNEKSSSTEHYLRKQAAATARDQFSPETPIDGPSPRPRYGGGGGQSTPRTGGNYDSNNSDNKILKATTTTTAAAAGSRSSPGAIGWILGSQQPAAIVGLDNLGNTCYFNSVLQCLVHTVPLAHLFASGLFENMLCSSSPYEGSVAESFGEIVRAVWERNSFSHVQPSTLFSQVHRFAKHLYGVRQQDSHELLRCLLDALHEDLARPKRACPYSFCDGQELSRSDVDNSERMWANNLARNSSAIMDLFSGQLQSSVSCNRCKLSSKTYDPFLDLSLPIDQKTAAMDRCLELFFEKENVEGYQCSKCKKPRPATKQLRIFRCPPVLVVHLKRFEWGERGGRLTGTKITSRVDFPLSLNLSEYYCGAGKEGPALYELFAITHHFGAVEGGHYIAECMNGGNERWFVFDDDSVREGGPTIDASAYLLFYRLSQRMPPRFEGC